MISLTLRCGVTRLASTTRSPVGLHLHWRPFSGLPLSHRALSARQAAALLLPAIDLQTNRSAALATASSWIAFCQIKWKVFNQCNSNSPCNSPCMASPAIQKTHRRGHGNVRPPATRIRAPCRTFVKSVGVLCRHFWIYTHLVTHLVRPR